MCKAVSSKIEAAFLLNIYVERFETKVNFEGIVISKTGH